MRRSEPGAADRVSDSQEGRLGGGDREADNRGAEDCCVRTSAVCRMSHAGLRCSRDRGPAFAGRASQGRGRLWRQGPRRKSRS